MRTGPRDTAGTLSRFWYPNLVPNVEPDAVLDPNQFQTWSGAEHCTPRGLVLRTWQIPVHLSGTGTGRSTRHSTGCKLVPDSNLHRVRDRLSVPSEGTGVSRGPVRVGYRVWYHVPRFVDPWFYKRPAQQKKTCWGNPKCKKRTQRGP